jgi:hypothetical protein
MPEKVRRTKALTNEARELFELEWQENGWQLNGTIPRIAAATGLTLEQTRDAVFAKSADAWRRDFARRLYGGTDAS